MSDARKGSMDGRIEAVQAQIPKHADMGDETLNRLADELDGFLDETTAESIDTAKLDRLMSAFGEELPLPDAASFDADAALRRFYARENGACAEDKPAAGTCGNSSLSQKPPRRALRILLIAAAAAALLLASVAIARFTSLRGLVPQWTSEVSRYTPDSVQIAQVTKRPLAERETKYYDSLQEMMDDFGVTAPLLPTWVPERFDTAEFWAQAAREDIVCFSARFFSGDEMLLVTAVEMKPGDSTAAERFGSQTQLIELNGIYYELMSDNGTEVAVWRTDVFDCIIAGPVSQEEMLQMIYSIYER